MTKTKRKFSLVLPVTGIVMGLASIAGTGCGDDDSSPAAKPDAGPPVTPDSGTTPQGACAAGGLGLTAAQVQAVVDTNGVAKLAGDTRIAKHFTDLPPDGLLHVKECFGLQVQELFGCPGKKYEANVSKDSKGVVCRDMKKIHVGLNLSQGDQQAFIEDVAAAVTEALKAANAPQDKIDAILAAAGKALTDLTPQIVAGPYGGSKCNTKSTDMGMAKADGTGGPACTKRVCAAGGIGLTAETVQSVVDNNGVAKLAGDCRISRHFTELPAAGLTHVKECFGIQTQELFGCADIKYVPGTTTDKAGVVCRDMKTIHQPLNLSKGDQQAFIEDVAGAVTEALTAANVPQAKQTEILTAAGGALHSLTPDIVKTGTSPSGNECNNTKLQNTPNACGRPQPTTGGPTCQ